MSTEGKSPVTVLAVDDDPHGLSALENLLDANGFSVVSARHGEEALTRALETLPDIIILDVQMAPGPDGYAVTRILKSDERTRYVPIVLLTAKDSLDDIIEGFHAGADDYIRKPYNERELIARVHASLRTRELYREIKDSLRERVALRKLTTSETGFAGIIGASEPMQAVFQMIERMSNAHAPVLITGESGSGKELVAHAIHALSPRAQSAWIAQNVAALSDSLLESELFGHVKGAFTGAVKDRRGLFEAAHGGTLFLDEVGEMSPQMQAKLLRVLQDGTFVPVGDTRSKTADVRIIAATHRPLEKMVKEGSFREDLFYRLNVIRIAVPPLRERRSDIPLLALHLLDGAVRRNKVGSKRFAPEVLTRLSEAPWEGNVRELQNEIERLVLMSGMDPVITLAHVQNAATSGGQISYGSGRILRGKLKDAIEDLERDMIRASLVAHDWNKSEVARELGISRSSLISKVQSYELETERHDGRK